MRPIEQRSHFLDGLFKSVPSVSQQGWAKGRTKEEVNEIIYWLTGYDQATLQEQLDKNVDYEAFFEQAPRMNPNASKITGVVCGIRVENIEDPLMQKIPGWISSSMS